MRRDKILVIDDEEALCEILKFNLEKEGYDVDIALSAEEALEMNLTKYNLFIVDIMMEKLSGFDFAKMVRDIPEVEDTPIIFCSALVGEDDKVMGLNMGGDDYVTKPFSISEVLARVRAVLRRSAAMNAARNNAAAAQNIIQQVSPQTINNDLSGVTMHGHNPNMEPDVVYKTLRLDQNSKQCTIDGEPVDLTKTEYDLLHFFLTHRNRVYSRAEIINQVWSATVVSDRTIDANVTRLRKKLKQYGSCIETRTGFGYSFKENLG